MKKSSIIEAINSADWVAINLIFPPQLTPEETYVKEQQFSLPLSEYTVCRCPAQRKINIYRRLSFEQ